jgi:hypothetical protein
LSTKLTPVGRVPTSDRAAVGTPVVVTVNDPAEPAVNVVLLAEVMAGAWSTFRVNDWVALGLTPLLAVMVIGYDPPVPPAGVPDSVAVPSPLSLKVTPLGRFPLSVSAGAGGPVVVTVKVPAEPAVNVVLLAEVMAGAS